MAATACLTSSPEQQQQQQRPPKSAKRQRAESALERRYSSQDLTAEPWRLSSGLVVGGGKSGGGGAQPSPAKRQHLDGPPTRPPVRVPACSDCAGTSAAAASGCAQAADDWCSADVALPPMDWATALAPVTREADMPYDRAAACHRLPGGIALHVVSAPEQLSGALAALRASMQDSCVGVDLEWRPEGWAGNGPSRVALMQLASATTAVLVRFSRLGYRMPAALRAFLSDPELTFVGFSWDGADEGKMAATFGAGRALFSRLIDLQHVGAALGYHGLGLGALARQVLGVQPPKSRKVTMSNWEARQLSPTQLQYAALDAVVTASVYRGLRLWHASPSACTACRQMLGEVLPAPDWRCHDCSRSFSHAGGMQSHRHSTKHRCSPNVCDECGRVDATGGGAAAGPS